MFRRTISTRRLSALTLSVALAFTAVACSNDDGKSSLPPATSTDAPTEAPADTTAPSGGNGGPTGITAPAEPLDAFADIDEATMNAYCDSVQAAMPLGIDNAKPIADAAPPAIAAQYKPILAHAADRENAELQQEAAVALFRLLRLHEDVCGIPVKFG